MHFLANLTDLEDEGLGALEASTYIWQQKDGPEGAFWDELHHALYEELERRALPSSRTREATGSAVCIMEHDELTSGARRVMLKRVDNLRRWWGALHRPATTFLLGRLLDAMQEAFAMTVEDREPVAGV